jgi:uncharacterized protein (DUF433 family)
MAALAARAKSLFLAASDLDDPAMRAGGTLPNRAAQPDGEGALPSTPNQRYDRAMEPKTTDATDQANELKRQPPSDRVRIVSTPGVCGGRPRIDGHRITVEHIAIWHERQGLSPDEIVSGHPSITLGEVHAALAYYYDNRDQIDADIAEGERWVAQMKGTAPGSLVQEKLRQRKADAANDPVPSG